MSFYRDRERFGITKFEKLFFYLLPYGWGKRESSPRLVLRGAFYDTADGLFWQARRSLIS